MVKTTRRHRSVMFLNLVALVIVLLGLILTSRLSHPTAHLVRITEGNSLDSKLLKTEDSSAIIFETEDRNTTTYILSTYLNHRKSNYNSFIALAFFIAVLTFIYFMSKLYVSYKSEKTI